MWVFIFLTSLQLASSEYIFSNCSSGTYVRNSSYDLSLQTVVGLLVFKSWNSSFGSAIREADDQIQGLYQCRLDISPQECNQCVVNASDMAGNLCPFSKSAGVWFDDCFLRYSDGPILSALDTTSQKVEMTSINATVDVLKYYHFVSRMLNDSADEVAVGSRDNFVAKEENLYGNFTEIKWLYSLVQCTEDLSPEDCSSCIKIAITSAYDYVNTDVSQVGRSYVSSCYIRYDVTSFFNLSGVPVLSAPPTKAGGSSKSNVVIIVVSVALAVVVFLVLGFLLEKLRRSRETPTATATGESCEFELAKIRAATGNFSQVNKLGQGGFGSVFKGVLDSGEEIAVKRLSGVSSQGAKEFKNEVLVVAKLQHRNLVKLLGFCAEEDENILVYEFVPNKSLDYILFGRERKATLSWPQRLKIIEGIGRGMLYLHEDSRLKIIHRDLKASNILLDSNMNPKIADFGMARIFDADQTRSETTRIVGTFGYMAPEYAMHGLFSSKTDVYSFGVLVLEIITGKKSLGSGNGKDLLIPYVWSNWSDQNVGLISDPLLGEGYSEKEVEKCVHIGLLCVQDDPNERPTMAAVLHMLNNGTEITVPPRMPSSFRGLTWSGSVGLTSSSSNDHIALDIAARK